MQQIVFGGGCFWCVQSVFLAVKGVQSVTCGYMGGRADTANYEAVCTGLTNHIEVVKVVFDDTKISLSVLLDIFFATHDPTSLDRQGNDIGSQYRSACFYDNDTQKTIIDQKINALKNQGVNIVTQVAPMQVFYEAENYHQDFFNKNPTQGYCNLVIPPKLHKLRQSFGQFIK